MYYLKSCIIYFWEDAEAAKVDGCHTVCWILWAQLISDTVGSEVGSEMERQCA